jgi:hypothetical protein
MRRVNAAGIPVAVDGINLTLHGWRADRVRYYSNNPDDLKPLFLAQEVYFSVRNSRLRETQGSDALNLDVEAVDVTVNPAMEWGVAIPQGSPSRHVARLEVSLRFLPERIMVSHGKIDWLGFRFNLNGTILKGERKLQPRIRKQETLIPIPITEEQFLAFESQLETLRLPNGVTVDIDFSIDTAQYAASRVDLAVNARELEFREVGFSRIDIAGSYAYPAIRIERAGLFQGKQSLQLSGEYNLDSKLAKGSLYNSITSGQPLLLLPDWIHDVLEKAQLRFEHLPRLEINFGPAKLKALLNCVSGAFAIRGANYQGIEIEALRGRVKRENKRLEFTNLQGSVLGQEERAAETGSAMHGGTTSGSAFWDENMREFGVGADVNFDPTLLIQALSPVEIATNIIHRFKFKGRPPQGHVELGSNVDDWSTFYIDIQAMANDVVFQGVAFDSVNATETYKHAKLNLDPVVAMQGADFIKGSALLDFRASTVSFDAFASMDPADLEDLIYPDLDLFGNHIIAGGDIRITARGSFDWGTMQQTDFSAQIEAEQLRIPVAQLDHFTAEVVGDGPTITARNAKFGLYGGTGAGEFSVMWNPPQKKLPYDVDLSFSGVDINQCLAFFRGKRPATVTGIMEGNARIEADFSTNFYHTANGKGVVRVKDGQLADLPLFQGFSSLMRKVFPSFKVFSITSLRGDFSIVDGVISSENAYFEGDILSATARGRYVQETGYDAYIQAQVLSEGRISRVVRVITNPLMKLLELKLEGTLSNPSWKLDKF